MTDPTGDSPDQALDARPAPAVPGSIGDLLDLARRLFGPDLGLTLDLPPRDPAQDRPPPDFGIPAP